MRIPALVLLTNNIIWWVDASIRLSLYIDHTNILLNKMVCTVHQSKCFLNIGCSYCIIPYLMQHFTVCTNPPFSQQQRRTHHVWQVFLISYPSSSIRFRFGEWMVIEFWGRLLFHLYYKKTITYIYKYIYIMAGLFVKPTSVSYRWIREMGENGDWLDFEEGYLLVSSDPDPTTLHCSMYSTLFKNFLQPSRRVGNNRDYEKTMYIW